MPTQTLLHNGQTITHDAYRRACYDLDRRDGSVDQPDPWLTLEEAEDGFWVGWGDTDPSDYEHGATQNEAWYELLGDCWPEMIGRYEIRRVVLTGGSK